MESLAHCPTIELKGPGPHRIWMFSDVHIGAHDHDWSLWNAHVERARRGRWRALCLGDAFEMVGHHDRVAAFGAIWEQDKDPPLQVSTFIDQMKDLIFDGAVEGNHDWRAAISHGLSVWDEIVLPRLRSKRSPAKYLGSLSYLRYRWGDGHSVVLCISHGEGPVANPMTTLYRMMLVMPDADVYAGGHTHDLAIAYQNSHHTDGVHRKILLRTGTYLGFARYAKSRILGKPQTPKGSILLTLGVDGSVEAEAIR